MKNTAPLKLTFLLAFLFSLGQFYCQNVATPPNFRPSETNDYMDEMDAFYEPLINAEGGISELALVNKDFRRYLKWKEFWKPALYPHSSLLKHELAEYEFDISNYPGNSVAITSIN